MFCSKDVRKILIKYPELTDKQFLLERILYKAYPANFNRLYKKNKEDFNKTAAMVNNGYFKNIKREIKEPNWDKIIFHYILLVDKYLDSDFQYESLTTLTDISNFSFDVIKVHMGNLKVKNLWYLRKVLINSINQQQTLDLDKLKFETYGDFEHNNSTIDINDDLLDDLKRLI